VNLVKLRIADELTPRNNIVYQNDDFEIRTVSVSGEVVEEHHHLDAEGDPLFADGGNGDFHLL